MYSEMHDVLTSESDDDGLDRISERRSEEEKYNEDGESLSSHSDFPIPKGAVEPEGLLPSDTNLSEDGDIEITVPAGSNVRVSNKKSKSRRDNTNSSSYTSNSNSGYNNNNNSSSRVDGNNSDSDDSSSSSSSSSEDEDRIDSTTDLYTDDIDESNLSLASEESLMCCTPSPATLAILVCVVIAMCGALAAAVVVGVDRYKDNNDNDRFLNNNNNNTDFTKAPVSASPTMSEQPTSAPVVTQQPTAAPATSTPTASPTALETEPLDPRVKQLVDIAGPAVLQDGTPQKAAADWILFDDPALTATSRTAGRHLQADDTINVQRFLLALFYYTTSQSGPWRSCNPSTTETDCRYSKLLGTNEDGTLQFQNMEAMRWLSAAQECEWMGVACGTDQNVTELGLEAQTLTGSLITEILELPSLSVLQVSYNELTGNLGAGFGRMQILNVENNNMGGDFPTDELFANVDSMTTLRIANNQFTGSLQTDNWSNAQALTQLDVSSNLLTGELPLQQIGQAASLKEFKAFNNQFRGRLADDAGDLAWKAALEVLWLGQNNFVGPLPGTIGGLQQLVDLRLANCMFSSSLPDSLYNLVNLKTLHLQNNQLLSGSISPSIGNLVNLVDLRLSGNTFTGAIPSELANAVGMTTLELNFNGFSGAVPDELCVGSVTESKWELLQADCQPPQSPPNRCTCCTMCCTRDDSTCVDNRDEALFRDFFVEMVGPQINEAGTPADRAVSWIVFDDPLELSVRAPNLLQRYLLALFYFHTTSEGEWTVCNPPKDDTETDDCTIPTLVEGSSDTFQDVATSRWLSGRTECKWAGVQCGGTFVNELVGISLAANGLANTLPQELQLFKTLQRLSFPMNKMSGELPEFLGDISTLKDLVLRNNTFDGTIAGRFFTGSTQFTTFDISENKFSGNFPNAIGRKGGMVALHINDNDFAGTITASLRGLGNLETLRMGGNKFGPSIPSELAQLKSLKELSLQNNQLSQSIPDELFTMSNLVSLDLSGNMLTGDLFDGAWETSTLESLVLYSNQLNGDIPAALGDLDSLQSVSLAFNNFEGSIPAEICNLPMLDTLVADCAGASPVGCTCCTGCCDPLINICFAS